MSNSDRTFNEKVSPSASSMLLGKKPAKSQNQIGNWRDCFPEIIGRSPQISGILEMVTKIAPTDSAVLIYGESGTGKELIARALHRLSNRSDKRIVPLNCSAIPEALLESELFGHEKGAFTGAIAKRRGHFEAANGGTLFLDEIGDMPLSLQAKLLRVLQDKQFTAVGGQNLQSADVRIIAATNINLEEAVKEGRFRLDLFYRLNVLPIEIPSLRDRPDDIYDLLDHFLSASMRIHPMNSPCYFSEECYNTLRHYDWPGNIRELQNLIERLVVIKNGGQISTTDLPREIQEYGREPTARVEPMAVKSTGVMPTSAASSIHYPQSHSELPEQGLNLGEYISNLENTLICQALDRTNNNKNQAARLLGMNRTTLVERIKKRKIQTPK